jgi:DNA-binding transcriptional LysR family regulator
MIVDLPSSGEIGRLVEASDLVATVTNLLAHSFQQHFVIQPGPFDSRVRVYQYWTTRTHRSRMHRRLCDLMAEEAKVASQAAGYEGLLEQPGAMPLHAAAPAL